MYLKNLEILNLWGRKKLAIDFKGQVTFLTGANGSGKSTTLNIIYDFLATMQGKKNEALTAKTTFWSAKVTFSSGATASRVAMPETDRLDRLELNKSINKIVKGQKKSRHPLHNLDNLEKLKREFLNSHSSNQLTLVPYDDDYQGVIWYSGDENIDFEKMPSAYIYQEDRSLSKSPNFDGSFEHSVFKTMASKYGKYRSNIDRDFLILRDEFQSLESALNAENSSIISKHLSEHGSLDGPKLFNDVSFDRLQTRLHEINKLFELLNGYFKATNKIVTRDKNGRVTLKYIGQPDGEFLNWDSLSRGEKVILFMFLTVFLNRERVKVFLLDEPEIAMHVLWQENFVRDLTKLAPDCQFIIATHSPSLIDDGWFGNCINIEVGNEW